uniref:signal recognition particle-docking protein FtsY n=1 Tax=Eubacterium cellulosolvens TaxID=29322 RepID=UPI000485D68C|nr:signal recognition particle-docking protein FtsY [[Eubacterium] cellulosolvens]
MGFFKRLFSGLTKSRDSIQENLDEAFGCSEINDEFYENLEEALVASDMGIETTETVIENLQEIVDDLDIKKPADCKKYMVDCFRQQMKVGQTDYSFEDKKSVVLIIGVNGVGKTTTVGKLAAKYKATGKKVMIAAADTFRAAAIPQLETWAKRAGVEIIEGQEGADPASVVYDAISAAKARDTDMLLIDTAGRLHNKKNLMEELRKIYRILSKSYPEASLETLLVLDGTTGQNAILQARSFAEVADITGLVITKLDGTAKGGIAVAVQSELDIPVKYIGVGEQLDDLQKFDPSAYVDALFDTGRRDD